MNLLLSAVDVATPSRWRWELRDEAAGEVIAEHHVSLDGAADSVQAAAFGDLREYVRWHADPLWHDDEPRIIRDTGIWARRAVLGDAVTDAITAAAPATVLVSVPEPADQALLWPLELAFADGAPLAARGDVSFVYRLGRSGAVPDDPVRPMRKVRVLAAFSSPARTGAIAQRRLRHDLAELIRRIVRRDGAAIELRVLQYGVTRQRLGEVIGSGGDWDVVHLSGHGNRAGFALERPDGSMDYASTADLVDLLRPALGKLKLAVLSSCMSAAEAETDTLRLLGLPAKETRPAPAHVSGLARGLAEELGCAVVATRYEVTDEFSSTFNQVFYERMLSGGDPVAVASAKALAAVLAGPPAGGPAPGDGPAEKSAPPSLEAATLGVFGASAVSLVLRAAPADPGPGGTASGAGSAGCLAGFPGQPRRFVGRDAVMTAASTALRAGSGTTTVLLHGMPGIGKTACALELACLYQDQFSAAAFWRPPAGTDPDLVLQSLAGVLHQQLGQTGQLAGTGAGFAPPPRWGRRRWTTYAQRLGENLRASRVLIVIDNLEELFSPGGGWLDPRWEAIFGALAGHDGGSRLIAASRFAPASLARAAAESALLLPVGTLPRTEAATLARELPALRTLMFAGQPPALGRVFPPGPGRKRVREALDRAQGHPALLELEDAAVSAQAGPLDQSEREQQSERERAAREQAERDIGGWAAATLAALPSDAKLMAWFVAGLEPGDRRLPVISGTWAGLWRRLGRPAAPPGPGPLLDTLSAATLTGRDDGQALLHPVVAAAIQREIPAGVRDAADSELGAYWQEAGLKTRAALAALPYLTRRQDWDGAAALLGDAIRRGALPADSAGCYLPELREVARFTAAPAVCAALALATHPTDQAEARRLLEEGLGGADSAGDYCLAWLVAGHLADALRDTGHLDQALDVVARQERYAQAAGLGPWTRLAGQSRRLAVLARMNRNEQVLAEMIGVRDRLRRLDEETTSGELPGIVPWAVRERILDTGRTCALAFGKWREALSINAEIQDSQRRRGASRHELAIKRFFDSYPLIRLRRLTEAAEVLVECQQVFEEADDTGNLSHVFSERADLAAALHHPDDAVRFARTALRLTYTRTIPDMIAAAHQRLARYLRDAGAPPEEQQAHWLAAALVYRLGGADHALDGLMLWVPSGLRAIPGLARQPGTADPPPWTLAAMTDAAEQTSGVHLAELITAMEPDADTVARALTAILGSAAGKDPYARAVRAIGRNLIANLGGYEVATDPEVASLVKRVRRWLDPQPGQEQS